MQAISITEFGDPEVLRLTDLPVPEPQGGQVLVAVHACGVNPVDTYIRAGIYGPRQFPFTPGMDAAGVVEQVGFGVARFKTGDRVFITGSLTGTYAAKTLCLEKQLHPLSSKLSFEQGAAIGIPYGTAYRALFGRAKVREGETVLIHGASGGVGLAALQLCRQHGIRAVGTAGTDQGREACLQNGAAAVVNHRAENHFAELDRLSNSEGFNVILEMLANANLASDLTITARFGRIVVIGSRATIEINPREAMRRDADILGMTLMNATEEELREIYTNLSRGFDSGDLAPVIGKVFPLGEAPRAHHEVIESCAYGKIVLRP